ncbi:MAG: magnesium transporter [Clostridia bacterium]|nr:magnesium transporter [Clostridia bacterium]
MEDEEIELEQILELLEKKRYTALHEFLSEMNPVDIALVLSELDNDQMIRCFRLLPKDEASDVFTEFEPDDQERLIGSLNDAELQNIISDMFDDDTADLLSEMPANVVRRILKNAPAETRRSVNELLKYPEDSAGSIMTTEFIELHSYMTVGESIASIRQYGIDKETIYTCYILDDRRVLLGICSLKDLLMSTDEVVISDLMDTNIISCKTTDDKEDVAKTFSKYGYIALPVVDSENRLVGIVTVDDAVDVLHDEVEEDFEKMAAVRPTETTYLKTPVFKQARNRLPWLLFLMCSAIATGAILDKYEQAFQTVPLLVTFLPMLMDTSGNAGTQVSTMIIRGLATDELKVRDYLRVLWKEFRVALVVSVTLAVVNGIRIFIQYREPHVALVIALTLICAVVTAKCIACSLPMLATKIHLDPALMATPLLTTIVDACTVFVYFFIATHLIPGLR